MRLVNNHGDYDEFIRTLRNDERVKQGFIQQEEISKKTHRQYMNLHRHQYYVCLDNNDTSMGYVGVVDGDIRICTHLDHQRKGVALFMLSEIGKYWPNAFAKIKVNNTSSQHLFEKAGFKLKYLIYERENDS